MKTSLLTLLLILVGAGLGTGLAVLQIRTAPWDPRTEEAAGAAAVHSRTGGGAGAGRGGVADAPPDAGRAPKLRVKETSFDFGELDVRATASHDFTFANEGQGALKLRWSGGTPPLAKEPYRTGGPWTGRVNRRHARVSA